MTGPQWEPHRCGECQQTTEYTLKLTRGVADIVKAFAVYVGKKGVNCVHPDKEMTVAKADWTRGRMLTDGVITPVMAGNIKHAKAFGLLAKVKGRHGNWCLTKRGGEFLRGRPIPRFAIQSKVEKRQTGYLEPEKYTVTIHQLNRDGDPYWEGVNFEIDEGEVYDE